MICRVHGHSKSGESVFGISDNRHCRDFDLVHFGRVDIYMDNARVRGKLTDFACDTIIEAQANADKHIRHADGLVDMSWAMHPRHAYVEGMRIDRKSVV